MVRVVVEVNAERAEGGVKVQAAESAVRMRGWCSHEG